MAGVSFDLSGKRALVTGASQGIGLACAEALAVAGAHVTLLARNADKLRAAVEALTAEGFSADALALDICAIPDIAEAVARTGPYDVLVNSAGGSRNTSALDTTVEDFDAVMSLNVRAAYFVTQAVARGMLERGAGGSIIHMSSQMGHVGGLDRAVYCASKHALEGMVKAMAIEWGPGSIRVNTVGPTFIRTALTAATFANPERLAWIKSKIKLPRVGEPEDVAGAVVFLASDASSMITGTAIRVDGGWTAG